MLKSRFVLFLLLVDENIEFYQPGKLRVNQVCTIFLSHLQSHSIKETKPK